jgi:(p)ppGpp synthase/HD superfamily hydrolase
MKMQDLTESKNLEAMAQAIAVEAHKEQMYGTQPYINHISDVVKRVKTITQDPEVIAAAWLHDVVEDTDVTIDEIKSKFGPNVAAMVWAVTGEGPDRASQMASAIAKIAQTPGAELVKSADRLSNAAASKAENKMKLYQRYKDEHTNLSPVLGNNELAQELVRLFAD